MRPIRYTVAVSFPDEEIAQRWLAWLRAGHINEVLAGGATAAEIIRCDGPVVEYEVRYSFPSRDAFDRYEREHAPRLRAEALSRFPPEHGVHYHRSTAVVLDQFPAASS
jgi:hypothetical protein